MITPQQTLERAYAALSAAAFAHPSAADEIGTQCSEAAKELRALLATQAQGQDAAPAEQPQDDEPTWQELEDFRKRHWTHWNAADNLLIAHLAQKLKCAARAKE